MSSKLRIPSLPPTWSTCCLRVVLFPCSLLRRMLEPLPHGTPNICALLRLLPANATWLMVWTRPLYICVNLLNSYPRRMRLLERFFMNSDRALKMTPYGPTYSTFYLILSHFASLILAILEPANGPYRGCDGGDCLLRGSGLVVRGESMEGHLGPNTTIIYYESSQHSNFFPGLILLYEADGLPKLPSAILMEDTSRQPLRNNEEYFARGIFATYDELPLGLLIVNRPTPDPDTRLATLMNGSLVAGIPIGLRSKVDPASLIPLPTPTEGCHNIRRCVEIYPVSKWIFSRSFVIGSNAVLVRRRLLLWP